MNTENIANPFQDAIGQLPRLKDWVRWGATLFRSEDLVFAHGTDNALDEAAFLVLSALQLTPKIPDLYWDSRLTLDEQKRLAHLFERRVRERMPASYLTNEAWFAGIPFYVDERVLVPRSPIAELIEQEFTPWIHAAQVRHILDLCTGSGCIGIAAGHWFPDAEIDLLDISDDALAVARINLDKHFPNDHRFRLIKSDLLDQLDIETYDVIVSNPPYVGREEIEQLAEEHRHEPMLGLASGEQGLDATLRILASAKQHLTKHGILIVEVGNSAPFLQEAFPNAPLQWLEFSRGGDGVFLVEAKDLDYFTQRIPLR